MKMIKAFSVGLAMIVMLAGCAAVPVVYRPPTVIQSIPAAPLQSTPHVLAIWLAPYIDSQGNYHAGSYIYTVVRPSQWITGQTVRRPLKSVLPDIPAFKNCHVHRRHLHG